MGGWIDWWVDGRIDEWIDGWDGMLTDASLIHVSLRFVGLCDSHVHAQFGGKSVKRRLER